MAANEVIANRALELMGYTKGQYEHCDPHNHVNRSQSTNDAYHTAVHIAICLLNGKLTAELRKLVVAFHQKGDEYRDVIKMGRTQLQDAVPMTLGQEFHAFGESLDNEISALERVENVFYEVNMGGTAIGTGLNATHDTQSCVLYSSVLKSLAIKLSKICNDLRLLSSGPRAGLHEINLPPMQPGSSIMPGKVNPVIPEVVNQVCFKAIANDLAVTLAAEGGQLQLNVMEPVMAYCILESQTMFMNASVTLRQHCVEGISANSDVCRKYVEHSIGVVTALNPLLGYEVATDLAAEALQTGKGIVELVREKHLLSEEQIRTVLDPKTMTGAGARLAA
jgi:aspartate ammonia-lyase